MLLLILIYITFISLGLPDTLLGPAWTVAHADLGADVGFAGVVTMVVTGCTILSSLVCERVTRRFGAGRLVAVSVLVTAAALMGFSRSPSAPFLLLMAIPLGFGAGAVDATLNNYVALRYKARHMSWLHCFWGIGAFAGPMLMSHFLRENNWRGGYSVISCIQFGVAVLLLLSLRMWTRGESEASVGGMADAAGAPVPGLRGIPGVWYSMLSFLLYIGVEYCVGLWGGSFLVSVRGFDPASAARWVALFYLGITAGRFLSGVLAARLSGPAMIRAGQLVVVAGAAVLLLPAGWTACTGMVLLGLGCAPIFPCMLHETPARFGEANSQRIMGVQMAAAYSGSMLFPPVLGWIGSGAGMRIIPFFLCVCGVLMLFGTERLNRVMQARRRASS